MFTSTLGERSCVRPSSLMLCLAASLCFSLTTQAQKSVGFRGGVALSSYKMLGNLDDDFDGGAGIGYVGEVNFTLPIGASGFSVVPLGSFTYGQTTQWSTEYQRMRDGDNLGRFSVETAEDKINTLGIATLFRYSLQGKSISPFFEMGPWFNMFLSGEHKYEGSYRRIVQQNGQNVLEGQFTKLDATDPIEFGTSNSDTYRKTALSWALGAGLKAEFEFGTLSIAARYVTVKDMRVKDSSTGPGGAVQLNYDPQQGLYVPGDYGEDDRLKLRNLYVTVGYSFPLGGY